MLILAGRALVSDLGTRCTIGACGVDALGQPYVVTAGHAAGTEWRFHGGRLGVTAFVRYRPLDCRAIRVHGHEPTALAESYCPDVTETDEPIRLIGFERPSVGLRVIRLGAKSRLTTGTVTHVDQEQHYDLGRALKGLFRTDIASLRGDSGGPIVTEPVLGTARLVGFVSGGSSRDSVTLGQPAEQAFEALGLSPMWTA